MNKKPVYFSQRDPAWATKPYQTDGETDTIKNSGCGPSCAAMLISTITGKRYTPEDACKWSVDHGYKAKNQGTYYSYFADQFAAMGISCKMLNWSDSYHRPSHPNHDMVRSYLTQDYYVIALMRRGHWTPGGHFVVVWWWDDVVHILDPNSTSTDRTNGDPNLFRNEVKYYWIVDARAHNHRDPGPEIDKEENNDMTKDDVKDIVLETLQEQYRRSPGWGDSVRSWGLDHGIFDGTRPNYPATRQEVVAMLRAYTAMLRDMLRDMED